MNPPFAVQKLGHVVVNVSDLEASKRFYTEVLGFKVSDIYPGNMMPGGMVFLRSSSGGGMMMSMLNGQVASDGAFMIANVPHPLDERPAYTASTVRLTAWSATHPGPDDPLRASSPRSHAQTDSQRRASPRSAFSRNRDTSQTPRAFCRRSVPSNLRLPCRSDGRETGCAPGWD